MGDAEEVIDLFLRYPKGLTDAELKQYDDIFADSFRAEIPSSAIKGELGGLTSVKAHEWVTVMKSLAKGMPDWQWHGQIWKPVDDLEGWEDCEEDGNKVRKVHFTTRIEAIHTGDGPNTLRLDGVDHKPTGKKVVFPLEWWTMSINFKIPPKITKLTWVKALDLQGCSTGGYSMVPGILFALGKPVPPVPQCLEYPYPNYPPADAVDPADPNWWAMRLEIFRQLKQKDDAEKDEMKRLLDRQVSELQQHLDYLVALEHYTEGIKQNPHFKPHYVPPADPQKGPGA